MGAAATLQMFILALVRSAGTASGMLLLSPSLLLALSHRKAHERSERSVLPAFSSAASGGSDDTGMLIGW